jgi:hypothetical protein
MARDTRNLDSTRSNVRKFHASNTGWMSAHLETAELAKRLIEESCNKQRIQPAQLTLHADRGTSMRSEPEALLLVDLGVTKHIVGHTSGTYRRAYSTFFMRLLGPWSFNPPKLSLGFTILLSGHHFI